MRLIKLGFTSFLFALAINGQTSTADLAPLHRTTLDKYLKQTNGSSLRLQTIVDRDYYRYMTENFGANFRPSYAVGDFNRDKRADFAVLLARKGKPKNMPPDGKSSNHNPDYPITLVVFNGVPGSKFVRAFVINLYGPPAAFIKFDRQARRLFYGVFETDSDTFSLVPKGGAYRVKSEAL